MGSFVKESDRRKIDGVEREHCECLATCSVGPLDGAQGECPPAAEGNGNLTRAGGGGQCCFFFARRGTHIILTTRAVAAGSRSPGAHLNKSSGRDPPGSRFSAPSGAE